MPRTQSPPGREGPVPGPSPGIAVISRDHLQGPTLKEGSSRAQRLHRLFQKGQAGCLQVAGNLARQGLALQMYAQDIPRKHGLENYLVPRCVGHL